MENAKTMFNSLLKVQGELTTIAKNKKAFKGSYATIEQVWESIRKIINDNGFVVYNKMSDKGVETIALHESGESLSSFIPFSGNTDPQEKGKEITYFRRYNLNSLFNVIVEGEDTDANKQIGDYQKKEISGKLAAQKLMEAGSDKKAREIYASLSEDERKTSEVIEAVKFIKDNIKK
jgi:hypothetical protein